MVKAKLRELVALKLKPKKDEAAKELYDRYQVFGYPTLLFLDTDGKEIDRLADFMTPEQFLAEVERIHSGDTFFARLERFDRDPAAAELLEQVVNGLTMRGDFAGIYRRIDAFQAANHSDPDLRSPGDPDPSVPLLLETMIFELQLQYARAGRLFRDEWPQLPEVSGSRGVPSLVAFVADSPKEMAREEQARRLREGRLADAGRLLAMMPEQGLPVEMLHDAATFAVDNGHCDTAAELFRSWYEAAGTDAETGRLHSAAWSLFLCRQALDLAVTMARAVYATDSKPNVADTLAHLLYVNGAVEEAIALESRAAAEAKESAAGRFTEVLEQMKAGQELEDRPEFDSYPE